MLKFRKWQTGTVLALTLGMTSTSLAPFALSNAANAAPLFPSQPYPQSPQYPSTQQAQTSQVRIPRGTVLPVTYDKDRIIVAPNETSAVTLKIARNVRTSSGLLLIPAGSQVEGELRPSQGGTQFFAKTLILTNGDRLAIDAYSNVVTRTETIKKGADVGAILTGAGIGAGAAAIIGVITGNHRISKTNVLIGGGLGALGQFLLRRGSADVLVVNPQTDLSLTLNNSLALNPTY